MSFSDWWAKEKEDLKDHPDLSTIEAYAGLAWAQSENNTLMSTLSAYETMEPKVHISYNDDLLPVIDIEEDDTEISDAATQKLIDEQREQAE